MFMGEYDHQLDTKGRMIIPSKFRYDLNERFIITKALINVYSVTLDEWLRLKKNENLTYDKKDAHKFMRMFFSSAVETLSRGVLTSLKT